MIPAIVLTLLVAAYRVFSGMAGAGDMQWLHNFSPVAAVVLCVAIYFPKRLSLLLPLGAQLVSDFALNSFYGLPLLAPHMAFTYPALLLVAALGWRLRGNPKAPVVLGASLAGSLAFYVLTNTGTWLVSPQYPATAQGWWQALTTGLPGWPPTWVFFRNSAVSDLFFSLLFLGCMAFRPTPRPVAQVSGEEALVSSVAR